MSWGGVDGDGRAHSQRSSSLRASRPIHAAPPFKLTPRQAAGWPKTGPGPPIRRAGCSWCGHAVFLSSLLFQSDEGSAQPRLPHFLSLRPRPRIAAAAAATLGGARSVCVRGNGACLSRLFCGKWSTIKPPFFYLSLPLRSPFSIPIPSPFMPPPPRPSLRHRAARPRPRTPPPASRPHLSPR